MNVEILLASANGHTFELHLDDVAADLLERRHSGRRDAYKWPVLLDGQQSWWSPEDELLDDELHFDLVMRAIPELADEIARRITNVARAHERSGDVSAYRDQTEALREWQHVMDTIEDVTMRTASSRLATYPPAIDTESGVFTIETPAYTLSERRFANWE